MTEDNIKVLVTGSTYGKFKELFTKVKQIHEKYGPFHVHLCTGDFFDADTPQASIDALLHHQIDIPLTTYFINGSQPLPDMVQKHLEATDGELCPNLYYLGKQGVLTTSEGLRIAFISGQSNETESSASAYTQADVQKLCLTHIPVSSPPGVDLLLSYQWPEGIDNLSQAPIHPSDSSPWIAELATALKPRYHFAASHPQFYEREPYKNIMAGLPEERPALHVTRFIGLGHVLNTEKQRWFYAFNLVPLSKLPKEALETLPDNTTECPFVSNKRKWVDQEEDQGFFWSKEAKRVKGSQPPPGYVCKRCKVEGHFIKDCPMGNTTPPEGYVCKHCQGSDHFVHQCPHTTKPTLDSCWFCLANPKLEKHLIVSIGNELYMTLAKGPVISQGGVPGKGHVLLIPITHYPTFGLVPQESQKDVITELVKYKSSLRQLFNAYDQDMVVFEVSRDSQRGLSHAHLQVVPIPKDKADQVERVARELAAAHQVEWVDKVPQNPRIPYFKLDLPNGQSLVHVIQPRERFNLQFGRLVVATVLGLPEREDWKACSETEEEEKENATLFKEAFKAYDFSLTQ
ncbi:CwfJ C-terminus 1-domain-containing protein-like protein [Gilbertella persicaria]|uniref:CwfJ C-terminus 1-domain-containing protein-like protein n=1 Tax=Gilbertella persicaria TaxID=101096 RepID=UPI00221F1BFF|nr:CwfJ C-terminus 1-domain-containing protein-like protein [Gilbertella persicaria]KAI8047575.1 CwfJ C-terminus 1-domain-containing protein-like protein [Gilbertella persicaria]